MGPTSLYTKIQDSQRGFLQLIVCAVGEANMSLWPFQS